MDYSRYCKQTGKFLGSNDSLGKASGVILGVPMDYTVSFKPGSRFGPSAIREASYGLEEYSFRLERDITSICYTDLGDLELPIGDVKGSLELAYKVAHDIASQGKITFALGGEHLVSWPLIKAVADVYNKKIKVLHFDAHADLRTDYAGRELSHATVMRHVCNLIGSKNVYQFGIRSGTASEKRYASENCNCYLYDIHPHLERELKELKGEPLYVSIDIDVVDPAYAPGTGTPEPDGVSSRDILLAVEMLKGHNVVGFDIVEIAPTYDPAGITAMLGAKMLREALLAFL